MVKFLNRALEKVYKLALKHVKNNVINSESEEQYNELENEEVIEVLSEQNKDKNEIINNEQNDELGKEKDIEVESDQNEDENEPEQMEEASNKEVDGRAFYANINNINEKETDKNGNISNEFINMDYMHETSNVNLNVNNNSIKMEVMQVLETETINENEIDEAEKLRTRLN
ncbi:hypothetical protein RCL_jg7054.t1 [Rhizophagus clarus]|uniref:Uncharacterized protein n=1 Tax=Rhizophagus clarus TaxID=94130 RepID=A0A8H3QZF7_9GLOM|nr:hypothetical protein RCL_jg7054.t1 [Rhizophagus clarus]